MSDLDILFINPGTGKSLYQNLRNEFAAIEPPSWLAYLSNYLARNNQSTRIFDNNLSTNPKDDLYQIILDEKPLLICIGIFGQHPSASTQTMIPARETVSAIKSLPDGSVPPILYIGPHPTSLPRKTIEQEGITYVISGDAFEPTLELLNCLKKKLDPQGIPGLSYRNRKNHIVTNPHPSPQKNIDPFFLEGDWHLLEMVRYRSHNWHSFGTDHSSPYAAIYTSLGCPYDCSFCCSNIQYQEKGIRYRSPHLVIDELCTLHKKFNINHIKIIDELFIFNKNHYIPILEGIIENDLNLNIWAYARTDSIDISSEHLALLKRSGVNWLALGIESASSDSLSGVKKHQGKNIYDIVSKLKEHGINIIGNYIYGLPSDSHQDLEETYNLSTKLNTEYINYYCSIAYPGTELYQSLQESGTTMSDDWSRYAQLSADATPLSTSHLTASSVLKFRDKAFHDYFCRKEYTNMITEKFGKITTEHISKMLRHKLNRTILSGK